MYFQAWLQIRRWRGLRYTGRALPVRVFCLGDLGFDLGKEVMRGLGRGDGALQGVSLPECDNLRCGILETNPAAGAMGA